MSYEATQLELAGLGPDFDDSDELDDMVVLGIGRCGTLPQMIGREAAEPTLKRIRDYESQRARALGYIQGCVPEVITV